MSESVKTVHMTRSSAQAGDGPTEADVHPNEVENYRAAGFSEADGDASKRKPKQNQE